MMNYILPHLGLGDYLLCNGLIRNLIKPNEEYILFTNVLHNVSIPFMFRDLKNLSYLYIPPVEFNGTYILPYIKHHPYHLYVLGYENLNKSTTFGKSCYKQFNIDFEKRWSDFYVERDLKREKEFFSEFNVKEGEYIFLHEGGSANENFIDRSKITLDLKIIEPQKYLTNNIFDYCYLIENAAEIHVIESAFFFLIDSIPTNGKLFAHEYSRLLYDYTKADTKKQWTIYK